MGITRDGGDASQAEIERCGGEARLGEERDKEGAETTVHMEGEAAAMREQGEGGDVVDDTVGEVGGGADEEDGVAIDEAGDG